MVEKTALVTGGAGFIGSHMVDRLIDDGYSVVVIDNESTGYRDNVHPKAHYILGDVTNFDDVENAFSKDIKLVIHIAGQASTIQSFSEPIPDLQTNVLGTVNIIQACLRHRVSRLLFASSMTVYGLPENVPVPEANPSIPISYYGITKYAAERYVIATAARNDLDFEFNATAFRMFNVYGERQRLDNPYQGVLGYFIGRAINHETIEIHGTGEQTRDFIYIADVVDAWMTAINNESSFGDVFNLGYGKAISINKLVAEVIAAAGKSTKDYPLSSGPRRPGDQEHMTADISKTSRILDWYPRYPLNVGLEKTIAWAKNQ